MAARPFQRTLMTPANASDMQRFSPQHTSNPTHGTNLRTPSSFLPKISPPLPHNSENGILSKIISSQTPNAECFSEFGAIPGRYHRALAKVGHESNVAETDPVMGMQKCPQFASELSKLDQSRAENDLKKVTSLILSSSERSNKAEMLAEEMLCQALLPPSAIHSLDIVGSTLDEKGLDYIRDKLSHKYSNSQVEHARAEEAANSTYMVIHLVVLICTQLIECLKHLLWLDFTFIAHKLCWY